MEARIQFRVDEQTKKLAQEAAESRKTTLSDECRKLTEALANEQRAKEAHEDWLNSEIDKAYKRFESGEAEFVSSKEAERIMAEMKAKIKSGR
ncbi:damage-inducible protein J [Photobacterium sp. 2_MG-2023]|uniref:damage-inducible protein J n=1 Tax=Photobacterium sp. 2_MG-2023 TaxID=3062663 RepID=UPI0026E40510|nr:damage-inducible protein J [Photobacterium sp. 2_MG-2023]MDO6583226.1 damage-inducible protein J [Photobacterium sp. 2_MG-2023]